MESEICSRNDSSVSTEVLMKWLGNGTVGSKRTIYFVLTLILVVGFLLISRLNGIRSAHDDVTRQQVNGGLHMVSSLNISEYLGH